MLKARYQTLIFPTLKHCTVPGCAKRIPVNSWFCPDHKQSGPRIAKAELEMLRTQLAFERLMAEEGWTYLYAVGTPAVVKFGVTMNLGARISAMRADSPLALDLLAAVLTKRSSEKSLHRRLVEHLDHGEWFKRNPQVDAVIALLDQDDDEGLLGFLNTPA